MLKAKLGWKREYSDPRDYSYTPLRLEALPDSFSTRIYQSKILDQSNLGSCVAHAVHRVLVNFLISRGKLSLDLANTPKGTPSRLQTYYNARYLLGTTKYDSGCYIRDAVKSLAKWGVTNETIWTGTNNPYDIKRFTESPPWYTRLFNFAKVKNYNRLLLDVELIKSAIFNNNLVAIGFDVYSGVENSEKDGIIRFPESNEDYQGGHAVALTGWDDSRKMFEFANSWSSDWGDSGYGWLEYKYITEGYSDDPWTITEVY